jgi:hypothetical protein
MTVNAHLQTFLDKKIQDYSPETRIFDPSQSAYRVSVDYDSAEEGMSVASILDQLALDPKAGEIKELIIGAFDYESSESTEEIVGRLAELKDAFKNLKALFIGDITYEECEISWIQQSDISPILKAYPELEHLQVRGSDGLSFSDLQHDKLRTLIVETGGLRPNVIKEVNEARLPALERLDLWLGSDNYGFESTVDDFAPILSGKTFPELRHLGLMNSEIQDEITIAVTRAPILSQLKVLDLSMGTLTDKGGAALLESSAIRQLDYLNLRHHFLSDEMMAKLKTLGVRINVDHQGKDDEESRYAEVTE